MPLVFALLMINALNLLTSFPNLQVADRQQPQAYPGTLDYLKFVSSQGITLAPVHNAPAVN